MEINSRTNGVNRLKYLTFLAFLATIPAANWLIGNVGTECIPQGPCLVPVGFGLHAPSGVLMIGLALVLRDAVQQALGLRWAFAAIVCGVVLSAFLAPPALVLASAVAFLLAETLDMAVYTPLKNKGWIATAVLASGIAGSIVDSAAFLWLAFGSLDYITGQIVGKLWMTLAAAAILAVVSRRTVTA
jgi:queuosine precursor transporter